MPNTEGRADVVLRPFTGDDIAPLGALFAASRASMHLFDDPYTVGEHAAYIAGLSVGCQIVVAERDSALAGFLSQTDGLISHLYVHPGHQHGGVGSTLLDDAIERYNLPLHLWCFEANGRARTLYESRGFKMTERRDGTANDEGLPDLRYELR